MRCPTLRELPPPPAGKIGWPWTEESPQVPEALQGRPWPKISIVTPSYNQAQFIEETIRSVLLQGYPDLEYLVIDGGSTDGSVGIIRKYEKYLTYWVSEPDEGMYAAINKGLRMSHGDVLAYLNSDDRYFSWTLAVVAQALAGRPRVGFAFGDMLNISEGSDAAELRFYPPFRLGHIQRSGFLGQPTVFWRRSVFDQFGGFDESLKSIADCDYWMRIGERYHAYKVNEVLAIERNHPHAKRLAQREALRRELRHVRSRYVRLQGLGYRTGILVDRIYAFLCRRYYLSRFLYNYFRGCRPSRHHGYKAWTHFLAWRDVKVSCPRVLASFFPRSDGRFVAIRACATVQWSRGCD
jgi:glycosyltransferase involved in cell wall biosynthesis